MPEEYLNKPAATTLLDPEEYIKRPAICCGGCAVIVLINLLVILLFVRPAINHRNIVPICFNNRQAVVRGIAGYINKHPGQIPPTDLSVYRIPAHLLCPEQGKYVLTVEKGIAELHCTLGDHDNYRHGQAKTTYNSK